MVGIERHKDLIVRRLAFVLTSVDMSILYHTNNQQLIAEVIASLMPIKKNPDFLPQIFNQLFSTLFNKC